MPLTLFSKVSRSLQNRLHAARYNRWHRRILRQISTPEMADIREKYTVAGAGYVKYFDLPKTVEFALNRAYRLNLQRSRPLRILDLGCGFGVFGLIAQKWGHHYEGLDIWLPDSVDCRLFREVYATLHTAPRIDGGIQRFRPIPIPDGESFDLITAFQIVFHRFNQPDPWGEDEWRDLLRATATKLNPKGVLMLHFSKPDRAESLWPESVKKLFVQAAAHFDGPYVTITHLGIVNLQ